MVVHEGEYREWVQPRRGGLSDQRRITYTAAPREHVVIKGSDQVAGWSEVADNVWTVAVANTVFGSFNPFAEEIDGDWIVYSDALTPKKHLGDVYLNGTSFYEVQTLAEVSDPPLRTEVIDDWTGTTDSIRNPEQTRLVWYAEVSADDTQIWANFQGADPNEELVEINVRRSVFYPIEHHIDYITVRGFELAQAACPWAPPTADQPGLIGPNWAKGWVIEDNVIHDAKCSAISLGKEMSTGHNYATLRRDKPGYQYQLESVFSARQIGWDREHVGSHLVRRNTIYDCGQNGIVGHLGCVFSTIEDNHIYNIALKREFYGYEIGGIKLHAAIDVQIRHNRIHDCSLGPGWTGRPKAPAYRGTSTTRTTGTSSSRSATAPTWSITTSSRHRHRWRTSARAAPTSTTSSAEPSLWNRSWSVPRPIMCRTAPKWPATPPSTAGTIATPATSSWAETRPRPTRPGHDGAGGPARTVGYDGHPASTKEFLALVDDPTRGDHERFNGVKQPVHIHDNVYASGARSYEAESGAVVLGESEVSIAIVDEGGEVYLEARLPASFDKSGSAPSADPTSNAFGSSTRSSKNPTGARRCWPPI